MCASEPRKKVTFPVEFAKEWCHTIKTLRKLRLFIPEFNKKSDKCANDFLSLDRHAKFTARMLLYVIYDNGLC